MKQKKEHRSIDEILNELKSHPDYIDVETWTKDDVVDEIRNMVVNYIEEEFDDISNKEFDMLSNDIDWFEILNKKDWIYFRDRIYHYNNIKSDLFSNYGSYSTDWIVPSIEYLPEDINKKIKRELALKLILKD
jgi:hypothetical protein